MDKTSNQAMAKNTLFLYFRMALVIIVGLYSSRVILAALGVEDYGIYNVSGSVIAIFGFLSGAIGSSSSRFITVELGKCKSNNLQRLKRCFTTTRGVHGILAIIIILISETLGMWIFNNKCELPADRIDAAFWVFQFSVITAVLSIMTMPYNALVIAHEHMSIYAYLGVIDAILKLLICYAISMSPIDKLVFYALLVLIIQIVNYCFYMYYCKKHFNECSFGYSLDETFFKPILGFTGWTILGSLSYMALTQGATVMLSFFFGPAIVAARALANQIKFQIMNFINNYRMAVNPQILKRYSSGDVESSNKLIFLSTSISFYLMLMITIPLIFEMRFILELWLENVPKYTVEFSQITLLEILFVVYDLSFYMIFQATGRLKENALICPGMDLVAFIILYFIYMFGGNVLAIAWTMLLLTIMQGVIVKPYLAIRLFGYHLSDFLKIYMKNGIVVTLSFLLPLPFYYIFSPSMSRSFFIIIMSVIGVLIFSYLFGFDKTERNSIKDMVRPRIIKIMSILDKKE